MAKRRRGFDRRPASVPPAERPAPPPSRRPAATSSARSRSRLALPLLVGVGVVIVVALAVLMSQARGTALPSTLPSVRSTPSTPAVSPTDGTAPFASPVTTAPETGPVAGLPCDVDERTTYHVHAHLNIRFEGELQPVPEDVGLRATCLYWLHTHAPHGVIHVEAPAETPFTLGQFFDVWGEPLSETQVLGRTVAPGESLFIFVDSLPYTGDPREILLADLVAIELQVGVEPLEPLPYTFPAEFQ